MITKIVEWQEFLTRLKGAGGSTDMQSSLGGRYPLGFDWPSRTAEQRISVVIYATTREGVLQSPPRDWREKSALEDDYLALWLHGGRFNDSAEVVGR